MNEIPRLRFDAVDSTMIEADRQIAGGRAGRFLVVARSQSGGQGRHGRAWASPPGNLYWTMALPHEPPWPRDYGLTFAAALAVADSLKSLGVADDRIRLKWPNDPLCDGRKIAGVLCRSSSAIVGAEAKAYTLVGIGLNVESHPGETFYPATSMRDRGIGASCSAVEDALTACFETRLAVWRRTGFAGLRDAYAAKLHGVGTMVRVAIDRDRSAFAEGRSLGVDATGALRVERSDGNVQSIQAGDVLPPL